MYKICTEGTSFSFSLSRRILLLHLSPPCLSSLCMQIGLPTILNVRTSSLWGFYPVIIYYIITCPCIKPDLYSSWNSWDQEKFLPKCDTWSWTSSRKSIIKRRQDVWWHGTWPELPGSEENGLCLCGQVLTPELRFLIPPVMPFGTVCFCLAFLSVIVSGSLIFIWRASMRWASSHSGDENKLQQEICKWKKHTLPGRSNSMRNIYLI